MIPTATSLRWANIPKLPSTGSRTTQRLTRTHGRYLRLIVFPSLALA